MKICHICANPSVKECEKCNRSLCSRCAIMGPEVRNGKHILPELEERLSTSTIAVARHRGYWSCGDTKTPVCHNCRLTEAQDAGDSAGRILLPHDRLPRIMAIFTHGLAYATLCKGVTPQEAVDLWLTEATKRRIGFDTSFTEPAAPAPKRKRKKEQVAPTSTHINAWTFPNGLYDNHGQPSRALCITKDGQLVDQNGRPVSGSIVCVWHVMRGIAYKLSPPSREFLG